MLGTLRHSRWKQPCRLTSPSQHRCMYPLSFVLTRDLWLSLVMFDLFLGLRQAVEGRAQDEAEIAGSRPLLGPFWDLGLCNGYGNVDPWVHP